MVENAVEEVRSAKAAFVSQLRSGVDGTSEVPNLQWSVAGLAAHVASLPKWWNDQHENADASFVQPDDFAALSIENRAHITEEQPGALADLIDDEFDRYLTQVGELDSQRSNYGMAFTWRQMLAIALSELIVHGRDLAAATGSPIPTMTKTQGHEIAEATILLAPAFVDPTRAKAQPNGTYHVKMRGGKSYAWELMDGTLTATIGKPARSDATMNAEPVTFVLSSLGRMSDARAALTGGVVAYGAKPWRLAGLSKIVVDGV